MASERDYTEAGQAWARAQRIHAELPAIRAAVDALQDAVDDLMSTREVSSTLRHADALTDAVRTLRDQAHEL